ncbi:MAG TPA: DEAD/DEAH box helicase [Flavobacterium sp.]|nr:DEAD/DEAH box helicase [Flavobacterium sp.]
MNLKKINTNLQQALIENQLVEAYPVLKESFGTIKSGADVVFEVEDAIIRENIAAISVIQKLEKAYMLSPRALIIVKDKEDALSMHNKLTAFGKYTDLRFFVCHEKTNIDEDKNLISIGIDVLVGTPERLAIMLSTAGYDVNQLKLLVIDDADEMLRRRMDTILYRMSETIGKTQRMYLTAFATERFEAFVDRTMLDSFWFTEEEEDEEEN